MKNKFKVGDLVQLSAAGNSRNQNELVRGGWGIVIRISKECTHHSQFPITTEWYGGRRKDGIMNFKPYELKFFKKFS